MTNKRMLTIAALVSVLLQSVHISQDIARGYEKGDVGNLGIFPIFLLMLMGILLLRDRKAGLVIITLSMLFGAFMPILHMSGRGLYAQVLKTGTEGGLFFVWANIALGTISFFALMLAIMEWWGTRSGQPR